MIAAMHGNAKILQLLLKNQANPNIFDNLSNTALHYALLYNYNDIVDLLL